MKNTYSKNSRQGLPGGPNEMFEKVKGIIVSQRGQWDFPGMNTMVPTDDGRITMRGVPYPVYGQDETGYGQMMYPNQEYQFPGKNVLELPMAQVGLQVPIQQPDALRVHMNINPNAEYMEKKKSDVLDLDNTLDYLVETRGGTRDLWGHMADTIGYHESGHTMDPLQMQNSGGPGRGIFQFEAPSLITAQNRYQRISDRLNLKPDPKILSAKSALELSPEQQYSLFLINLAESSAKLKDYADNKLPLVDLWLQGHKKIEKGENRGSFRTSVQKAKDKSIQKGYDSFKQLGGALPRFQYEGQFNPQLARPNPLTGKYAWEQSIPKKTAVNVAPKMQPAARATTNVQKQNLNLDRDNRLLDANLIYSDASSNPLSNAVHTGLDAVGMVPVIGEPADVANALLYNYEGDLENAALSTAGMIPFLGMLGTGKRLLGKAKKAFSQRGEDFGPERLIPEWGDRANPKLLVQSPPEIKSVFKGVPHYGKDPALEAAKGALDVMKEQGRYLDNISFDASKLSPEQVKFHGIKHGRAVVEVALPNGNTQLFYKSSGLAGKSGAGVGNTTQDLWQPYGGHASNYASSNWFIKDEGFKDWYGSKSFRDISGNLDRIAAQGNYDLSGQLKAFKQLGGSLPKAQMLGEFNPQSFQPNPITGLYNWEKPRVKPTLSDFEPKQKAAPRSSTSVATKSDPVKAARQINSVAAEEYERNRQGVIRATNRPVSVFRPGVGNPEAVMEYTGVPSAVRIAQNTESVNDFLSGVDQLILGSSPVSGMIGMRRDFTPEETQALLDYSTVATMGLPLVRGAGKLGAQGLKQTGKYLTQGPLRNTYKYNPWAFKPNESNWYRQVGKSAIDDALETGLVREIGEEVSPRMWGEFQNQIKRLQGDDAILDYNERYMQQILAGRRPNSPYFAKGKLFYPMDKKVTMTKSGKISKNPAAKGTADYLIETDLPNESFQPAYVKGMYLGVPEEIGSTAILKPNPELRSLENFNLYKKNWWQGYKPINTPKQLPGSPNALIGNNGMFDMTNPNIYKALAPVMGIGAGAYGVNQMQDAQPMQRFGGNLNFQKGGDYNMKRASELGYTPDEAGHYPSVDEETGIWLKSKQHPTAWMESMYGYQLNPEVYNNYNVTYNPEGYFGENQLQYMSKQFGGSLPTAGDPVLNFIQRQSPRFSKSKK